MEIYFIIPALIRRRLCIYLFLLGHLPGTSSVNLGKLFLHAPDFQLSQLKSYYNSSYHFKNHCVKMTIIMNTSSWPAKTCFTGIAVYYSELLPHYNTRA